MIRRELKFLCFINDDTWNVKNGTSINDYERHLAEIKWGPDWYYYCGGRKLPKGVARFSDEALSMDEPFNSFIAAHYQPFDLTMTPYWPYKRTKFTKYFSFWP